MSNNVSVQTRRCRCSERVTSPAGSVLHVHLFKLAIHGCAQIAEAFWVVEADADAWQDPLPASIISDLGLRDWREVRRVLHSIVDQLHLALMQGQPSTHTASHCIITNLVTSICCSLGSAGSALPGIDAGC